MDQTHNCDKNAYCVNREPDFECYCFDGYEGIDQQVSLQHSLSYTANTADLLIYDKGDGTSCSDIDECLYDSTRTGDACPENGDCVNTPGNTTILGQITSDETLRIFYMRMSHRLHYHGW